MRGQAFLALTGQVADGDVPALRRKLSAALEGEPHDLVVDLRSLWGMCDEAVALLAGVASRQKSRGKLLTLIFAAGSPADQALHDGPGGTAPFNVVRAVPDWHPLRP